MRGDRRARQPRAAIRAREVGSVQGHVGHGAGRGPCGRRRRNRRRRDRRNRRRARRGRGPSATGGVPGHVHPTRDCTGRRRLARDRTGRHRLARHRLARDRTGRRRLAPDCTGRLHRVGRCGSTREPLARPRRRRERPETPTRRRRRRRARLRYRCVDPGRGVVGAPHGRGEPGSELSSGRGGVGHGQSRARLPEHGPRRSDAEIDRNRRRAVAQVEGELGGGPTRDRGRIETAAYHVDQCLGQAGQPSVESVDLARDRMIEHRLRRGARPRR